MNVLLKMDVCVTGNIILALNGFLFKDGMLLSKKIINTRAR